jgi:hypothetical protein
MTEAPFRAMDEFDVFMVSNPYDLRKPVCSVNDRSNLLPVIFELFRMQ